jgi:hypothetical protein
MKVLSDNWIIPGFTGTWTYEGFRYYKMAHVFSKAMFTNGYQRILIDEKLIKQCKQAPWIKSPLYKVINGNDT